MNQISKNDLTMLDYIQMYDYNDELLNNPVKMTMFSKKSEIYHNFNTKSVKLELDIIKNKTCEIYISEILKQFKCDAISGFHIIIKDDMKFKKITFQYKNMNTIYGYYRSTKMNFHEKLNLHGDEMTDSINYDMLKMLKYLKITKKHDDNIYSVPFAVPFADFGKFVIEFNNFCLEKTVNVIIDCVTIMDKIWPAIDITSKKDNIFFGKKYVNYYIKNENLNDDHIVDLSSFNTKLLYIFILLQPLNKENKIKLYGSIMKEDTVIAFVDPTINFITSVHNMNIQNYDENIYIVPFTALSPKKTMKNLIGYLNADNLKLNFKIDSPKDESVYVQIWGMEYVHGLMI